MTGAGLSDCSDRVNVREAMSSNTAGNRLMMIEGFEGCGGVYGSRRVGTDRLQQEGLRVLAAYREGACA